MTSFERTHANYILVHAIDAPPLSQTPAARLGASATLAGVLNGLSVVVTFSVAFSQTFLLDATGQEPYTVAWRVLEALIAGFPRNVFVTTSSAVCRYDVALVHTKYHSPAGRSECIGLGGRSHLHRRSLQPDRQTFGQLRPSAHCTQSGSSHCHGRLVRTHACWNYRRTCDVGRRNRRITGVRGPGGPRACREWKWGCCRGTHFPAWKIRVCTCASRRYLTNSDGKADERDIFSLSASP